MFEQAVEGQVDEEVMDMQVHFVRKKVDFIL